MPPAKLVKSIGILIKGLKLRACNVNIVIGSSKVTAVKDVNL
jgi:hypothetical protein